MQEQDIRHPREIQLCVLMFSAQKMNNCQCLSHCHSLVLLLFHLSRCRLWNMLFCSIFLFLISRVLFDKSSPLVFLSFYFRWCLCCSTWFCLSLYPFLRQLQVSPGWLLLALSLPARPLRELTVFGYHCLTKTKVNVQTGLGLPRRQISRIAYLPYLYFSWM